MTTCPCLVGVTTCGTGTLSSILGWMSTTTDCMGWPDAVPIATVVVIVGDTCWIALMTEGSVVVWGKETEVDRGGGGGGTFFLMTVVDTGAEGGTWAGSTWAGTSTGDGRAVCTGIECTTVAWVGAEEVTRADTGSGA